MTGPMVWTVAFDQPAALLSMNDRAHWRIERKASMKWRYETMGHALQQIGGLSHTHAWERCYRRHTLKQRDLVSSLLGTVAPLPPCTVQVLLPVADRRARDPHNYFKTVKPIVDGLVDAGLWPDDTPDWVTTVEPRLVVKAPKVVITLTERTAS